MDRAEVLKIMSVLRGAYPAFYRKRNNCAYSLDGETWNTAFLREDGNWCGITYGNGRFLAVSREGKAVFSDDAVHWQSSTLPISSAYDVAFGNGMFVVIPFGGAPAYSADGEHWVPGSAAPCLRCVSITYGDGKFVTVGNQVDKAAYALW